MVKEAGLAAERLKDYPRALENYENALRLLKRLKDRLPSVEKTLSNKIERLKKKVFDLQKGPGTPTN